MTDAAVTIRRAEPGDGARIVALLGELGAAPSLADGEANLRSVLRDETQIVLVAADGAGIVGCVHGARVPLLRGGLTVQIFSLAIDPARRRSGLGRRLTEAIEEWGRGHGCVLASARCNTQRSEALRFWSAVGYENSDTQHAFRKRLAE
jgi:ribosomal protein S18 acetylase RimI-like enzyme